MEEVAGEDMPKVEAKRRVTKMDTELSKDPLDETNVGYQPPEQKDLSDNHPPRPSRNNKNKEKKLYNPDLKEKIEDDRD
jgi:hypothetical protein